MSMIISQDYMETYVIKPMARRFADLEKKIDKLLECKCELKESIPGQSEVTFQTIQDSRTISNVPGSKYKPKTIKKSK